MATFTCFEEIKAWQKARVLCSKIFHLSTTTDLAKDYKLRDQINRSSGSVMDNIAEGFGRGGNKEFVQFLEVSHGLPANVNHNYAGFWIGNIFLRRNLMISTFYAVKLEAW